MRHFFQSLFGSSDRLSDVGKRSPGEAFVNAITAADVYIIAAMQSDGLNAETFTKEELLAEVERAARDLHERRSGFEPFVYQRDGVRCLPFFSTQGLCEVFCGKYSKRRNRVFPFQVLKIKGIGVAQCSSAADRIILNDSTPHERLLSDEEKRIMEELPPRNA